jgi:hypothetical protein
VTVEDFSYDVLTLDLRARDQRGVGGRPGRWDVE